MSSSTSLPTIESATLQGGRNARLLALDTTLGALALRLDIVYHVTLKMPRPPPPRPSLKDHRVMIGDKCDDYMYLLAAEGPLDAKHTGTLVYALELAVFVVAAHIASVARGIGKKMIEKNLGKDTEEFERVMAELKAVIDGVRRVAQDVVGKDLEEEKSE